MTGLVPANTPLDTQQPAPERSIVSLKTKSKTRCLIICAQCTPLAYCVLLNTVPHAPFKTPCRGCSRADTGDEQHCARGGGRGGEGGSGGWGGGLHVLWLRQQHRRDRNYEQYSHLAVNSPPLYSPPPPLPPPALSHSKFRPKNTPSAKKKKKAPTPTP